jgi:hypothetical protein
VVADALKAAEHGRGSVVPGGPQVRLALGSTRFVPTPLVLPILKANIEAVVGIISAGDCAAEVTPATCAPESLPTHLSENEPICDITRAC